MLDDDEAQIILQASLQSGLFHVNDSISFSLMIPFQFLEDLTRGFHHVTR